MNKNPDISQEYLKERIVYDELTGVLTWLRRPLSHFKRPADWKRWNNRYAGKRVGTLEKKGYRLVTIDARNIREHRLIWFYIYGYWPLYVDHINHKKDDNRKINLRDVDYTGNSKNRRAVKNKSGVTGVYWNPRIKRWRVQIAIAGKNRSMGHFKTIEEAAIRRKELERQHGYHYNHGSRL